MWTLGLQNEAFKIWHRNKMTLHETTWPLEFCSNDHNSTLNELTWCRSVWCVCVITSQREVKRIRRRFLWWPTEERAREGGEQSRGVWSLFVCRLGRLDLDQRLRVKTSFEDVFLTWRFLPSTGFGSIPLSFGLIQLEFLYALKWQEHGAEMKAFRYRIVRIKHDFIHEM